MSARKAIAGGAAGGIREAIARMLAARGSAKIGKIDANDKIDANEMAEHMVLGGGGLLGLLVSADVPDLFDGGTPAPVYRKPGIRAVGCAAGKVFSFLKAVKRPTWQGDGGVPPKVLTQLTNEW